MGALNVRLRLACRVGAGLVTHDIVAGKVVMVVAASSLILLRNNTSRERDGREICPDNK